MTEEEKQPETPEAKNPEAPEEVVTPIDPIADLQTQLAEMKDKYLRALADGENARKRLAKEKQEIVGFAIESAIGEFLPAIDHFENALKNQFRGRWLGPCRLLRPPTW